MNAVGDLWTPEQALLVAGIAMKHIRERLVCQPYQTKPPTYEDETLAVRAHLRVHRPPPKSFVRYGTQCPQQHRRPRPLPLLTRQSRLRMIQLALIPVEHLRVAHRVALVEHLLVARRVLARMVMVEEEEEEEEVALQGEDRLVWWTAALVKPRKTGLLLMLITA